VATTYNVAGITVALDWSMQAIFTGSVLRMVTSSWL